jgi:hypothetical protein
MFHEHENKHVIYIYTHTCWWIGKRNEIVIRKGGR